MKKKLISIVIALTLALSLFTVTALAATATPTSSTVLVNGKNVAFDAYNIGGNNFFKLRDLAYTLNGTAKQFEVGYDNATRAITLTSGKAYTPVGGEMEGKGAGSKSATPTTSKIYMDGKEVQFTAYNIGGNNYFKLRDIGEAFDFGVDWDQAAQTIRIDTSKGYTPEGETSPTPTTPTPSTGDDAVSMNALVGTWGCRSGGGEHFYFVFKADGRFTYYTASTYSTNGLFTRYEFYTKGKYRVEDYVLEFYDCQRDSHSGASWKYFSIGGSLDLQYDIPFDSTPLEDPNNVDGASMMFEFGDSMTLRIISEAGII